MKQNDINHIKNQIKVLVGATGITIGRIASMSWIGFHVGDSEYALHLQTAFRIRTNEKILIANLDMFEPTETLKNSPSFDWDTFDWDVQGFNRYDEWVKQFKKENEGRLTIQKVTVSNFGDLLIELSQNVFIEVFQNTAAEECWRFFERNSKNDHLVVTGQGIE
ncbi:MAG: hypothetical protein ACOX6U_10745 [Oscillospiraceae bacterium]